MLKHDRKPDSRSLPVYTTLPPVQEAKPDAFTEALPLFFANYPEFSKNSKKLQILHYCFTYYSSLDPDILDLPILERLAHAANMAKNFFAIVTGVRP